MNIFIVTKEDYMDDTVIVACFKDRAKAFEYVKQERRKLSRSVRDMGLAGYRVVEERLR